MGKPNNSIGHVKLPGDSVQRPIVPQQLWDGTTNYAASLPTLTADAKILLSAVSVTYAQLRTLMNNNQLLAGAFYRITDFVTTTAQARTRSAGHQFDLIVHAISNNELSEDANAVLHEGDNYFANSNLKAWVIKYSFNNDATRYSWADTTNGKGVIYYMKDEFHNECGYDFKNIQFARYKVTACANCPELVGWYLGVLDYSGSAILTNYMTIDTTDYEYYYTFDCCKTDYSMNAIGTTLTRPDGTTFTLNQIQCTKCLICPDESDSTTFHLNNFTMILQSSRDCMFRIKGWCQHVTFLGGVSNSEITSIYNTIMGSKPNGYIDGYAFGHTTIHEIDNSLICCAHTNYALYSSQIEAISNSCIIGVHSCIYLSTITYIMSCILKVGGAASGNCIVCYESMIGYIASCNISALSYVFSRVSAAMIANCTGEGATYYCSYSNLGYVYRVSMSDTSLNSHFIYYSKASFIYDVTAKQIGSCSINMLRGSSFIKGINNCNFIYSLNIVCAQALSGCNFGGNTNYLNISSTDTTQIITNTNFHDIAGTASAIKNVVIPEDYTNPHTVEIYSSNQYVIHEID